MLELTDDCFSYLFDISYPFFKDVIPLFITYYKLNIISNTCTNNILQKNYKLLIRDYDLKNPKKVYNSIYKIYGDKFVMCRYKLFNLANQSVTTDNIELLDLLYKNASNSMKSRDIIYKLFESALNIKSLDIIVCLLEQYSVLEEELFEKIIHHYYYIKVDAPIILKIIINKNIKHKDIIISKLLTHDDLDILKLFINDTNCYDLLTRAIKISNIKAVIYIIEHFDYDKNIVESLIKNKSNHPYMTQGVVDVLKII